MDVLLISTVIAVLSVLLVPDEIFTEQMTDPVSRRGRPVELTSPPEQIARWGRAMGMLGTLATHPMIAFVIAGLLTLIFTRIGRGRGGFMSYLSLSAHALLIPAAGTLVWMAIHLTVGQAATGGPLSALIGAPSASRTLLAALWSVDPFLLWMLVALAIGVREIDGRRSAVAAAAILIPSYLLVLVAGAYLSRPPG
jgi:hypothetical protein